MKYIKIRDVTLRDGQQSQFATRMTNEQVKAVLGDYKESHFYAMEVWGGAVPDSVMRYLDEDPWDRLATIKRGIGEASKLTALSRGRNLFGYTPYPDSVIEGFCKNAIATGVDIMRIFDALNDIDNMKSSIRFVKAAGGLADCAVCYTTDPHFSLSSRLGALFSGKKIPPRIFTVDYYVKKAKELASLGADMITIKDMAGLIDPATSAELTKALKSELDIPVDLHTHSITGFGVASLLAAMVNGVDIVDTAVLSFSGGPAAPAYEIIRIFADRLGLSTDVDNTAVARIDRKLRQVRAELSAYDQFKKLPPELDLSKDSLPPQLSKLFDDALETAVGGKYQKSLVICQEIEKAFSYPEPNQIVRRAQIPGGMYTNMTAQLKQAKLEQNFEEVLHLVPHVRLDSGLPPLVTPTSQIVGVQAVNCIISLHQGKEMYENVSKNFAELILGSYGKTPWPVDPEFRYKICGTREEKPYDTSQYKPQENPSVAEAGGTPLATNEKEQLLLELFPSVATKFLRNRRIQEWELAHPGEAPQSSPSADASARLSPYEADDYEPADGEAPSFWEKAPEWAGWTDVLTKPSVKK